MPPPRRPSPRGRDRRTRSRSYSPRPSYSNRRRSRSRSPRDEREKRRSVSPARKRSPPRRRSRSPHERSRSPRQVARRLSPRRSPRRRSRSHSYDRSQPVKRVAADSTGKRISSYRSRSPSPVQLKRVRDEREYIEERRHGDARGYSPQKRSPERRYSSRGRSPSPRHKESSYGGKMYSDKPSSSSKPLFPVEKRRNEISSVTIINKARLEKLDKRFQTLEQIQRGGFDFEENITIGIHRGPSHVTLDEDIPVNYHFNSKNFVMLHPKKETNTAIFDRDEILQFHHDDILDEEAYVEKRTITVKPTEKTKPKWDDSMDYKITVGRRSPRDEEYGSSDRRLVRDSSGRRRSRDGSRDRDPEITVRLDPKPDPRYERLFKETQRRERSRSRSPQDPHDLRHNLNKRRDDYEEDRGRGRERDRDRDFDRDRDLSRDERDVVDARRRIEARRSQGGSSLDRASDLRVTKTELKERRRSQERMTKERGRASLEEELPDFKNRPVEPLDKPKIWIIGTSVVRDVAKEVAEGPIGKNLGLDEEVTEIKWHAEGDMTVSDILPAVTFMLKTNDKPDMIVIQCGDNDICEGKNSDNYDVMSRDLKIIQEKIPGVRLVWCQILPPWNKQGVQMSSLNKSRRRINRFIVKAIYENDGCYLKHTNFTLDAKNQMFRSDTDNYLHLSEFGVQKFLTNLKDGIRYFISGLGILFPFLETWPPENNSMQSIHPKQIPCLSYLQIRDLTKALIKSMSSEQIAALTPSQIEAFGPQQIAALNNTIIQAFTPTQIPNFSRRQIQMFTLKQLELFSKQQMHNCTDAQKGLIIDLMKQKIQEEADIR